MGLTHDDLPVLALYRQRADWCGAGEAPLRASIGMRMSLGAGHGGGVDAEGDHEGGADLLRSTATGHRDAVAASS